MKKEIWKSLKGYEGIYMISTLGNVFHIKKNRLLTISIKPTKYCRVWLFDGNGNKKSYYIHRLVALNFIPNLNNKPQVNHIDFNPLNNHVDNLEWSTSKENVQHSRKNNRYPINKLSTQHIEKLKKSNSKKVIDNLTGEIFSSASEAAEKRNLKKSTLIHYLIGSRKNKTTLSYL